MRHFLLIVFATLSLVMTAGAFAPAVLAATPYEICSERFPGDPKPSGYYDCLTAEAGLGAISGDSPDPIAAKTVLDNKETKDEGYNFVMQKIMSLFAWLLGVAAILLDNVVYYTVVKMGDFVNNLSAIGVTWRILRDIGNIMLIFGFLAAGITTILNVDWYGGGKKMIPMLLVAAVFLNFSLFISEAIIDTGNLFATQFYTQINGGNPAGVKSFDPGFSIRVSNEGISNKIMSQLGLQTIYGDALDPVRAKSLFTGANQWFVGFMGILLFLVAAFVMFSLAFILIARFVVLLFLIILAPVGFAGLAVPKLASTAKKWWDELFEQTITAPVLLLTLYIALAVITDVQFLTSFGISGGADAATGVWTGFVNNANLSGFASMMLSFLVAMGLLLAVVLFSKKLSAAGAGWASKSAGALSFGATAWGMRNSGGWLATKTARGLRKTFVSRVPLVGTGLVKGLDRVGAASFDVRGTGALKNFPGGGIDAGTAQKGGYKAELKERIESRTKYAGELKGRDLTDEEKLRQTGIRNEIKDLEKVHKDKGTAWIVADKSRKDQLAVLQGQRIMLSEEEYKAREEAINSSMTSIDKDVKGAKEAMDEKQKELEKIESVTDTGAKRKYARNLQVGYLGLDEKSFFNKYINFAANTEAAKKILKEAKETTDDKALKDLQKAIKAAAAAEAETTPSIMTGGTTPPTAGAASVAPTTPPAT